MKSASMATNMVLIIAVVIVISAFFLLEWNSNGESDVIKFTTSPFLWRIEGDNSSYLFGSIHLADESVLTLPDVVIDALNEVDAVFTEVELDASTQTISDQLSKLPTGQTLDDLLPQDVYDRLDSYLRSKGFSLSPLTQYKIWAVTSTITLLDEMENLLSNPTLDQYIWNLATSNGKHTDGIETIQEQINIFDSFSTEEQIDMLNGTLDELENYANTGSSVTGVMLDAYVDGDLQVLQDLTLSGIDENDPLDAKFIARLITDRNYNMTQRITQFITDNPDTQYFFTVGAGHYYGEEGLITLLENEGFTVTRVPFNECDSCDSGETMINSRCYEPYVTK